MCLHVSKFIKKCPNQAEANLTQIYLPDSASWEELPGRSQLRVEEQAASAVKLHCLVCGGLSSAGAQTVHRCGSCYQTARLCWAWEPSAEESRLWLPTARQQHGSRQWKRAQLWEKKERALGLILHRSAWTFKATSHSAFCPLILLSFEAAIINIFTTNIRWRCERAVSQQRRTWGELSASQQLSAALRCFLDSARCFAAWPAALLLWFTCLRARCFFFL